MSDAKMIHNRIRSRLSRAMRRDRYALTRELDRIEKSMARDSRDASLKRLNVLEKKLDLSAERKARRKAGIPRITYPEALPITARKDEIIGAIRRNPVVVITGETGSGKTTQIPKMCLDRPHPAPACRGDHGRPADRGGNGRTSGPVRGLQDPL